MNQSAIESAAHRDGFHVIRGWSVGQDQSGALLLWQRGNTTRTMNPPPPVTEVACPRDGSDVRGSVHVVATVSDRFFAATGVRFTVSGMGRRTTIPAVAFEYRWLGALDTSALPDGTYTIQGVAVDVDGGVGRSKPVTFHIDNLVRRPFIASGLNHGQAHRSSPTELHPPHDRSCPGRMVSGSVDEMPRVSNHLLIRPPLTSDATGRGMKVARQDPTTPTTRDRGRAYRVGQDGLLSRVCLESIAQWSC